MLEFTFGNSLLDAITILSETRRAFNLSELRTIAFSLDFDYEDYPREKESFAVRLLNDVKSYNRTDDFLKYATKINEAYNVRSL
jgi:hypothetical protein